MAKIGVIGLGQSGLATVGDAILKDGVLSKGDEIVLIARNTKSKGRVPEVAELAMYENKGVKVSYVTPNSYENMKGCDVVVITASVPLPKNGFKTREWSLFANDKLLKDCAESIKKYSPNALVLVDTNPVDVLCSRLVKFGIPANQVVGKAGELDTLRIRKRLAEAIVEKDGSLSVQDVYNEILKFGNKVLLGGLHLRAHMVGYIDRDIEIRGKKVSEWLTEEEIKQVIEEAKVVGLESSKLIKDAVPFQSSAMMNVEIIKAALKEKKELLVSAPINGLYGSNKDLKDVLYTCTPATINKLRVTQPKEIEEVVNSPVHLKAYQDGLEQIETYLKRLNARDQFEKILSSLKELPAIYIDKEINQIRVVCSSGDDTDKLLQAMYSLKQAAVNSDTVSVVCKSSADVSVSTKDNEEFNLLSSLLGAAGLRLLDVKERKSSAVISSAKKILIADDLIDKKIAEFLTSKGCEVIYAPSLKRRSYRNILHDTLKEFQPEIVIGNVKTDKKFFEAAAPSLKFNQMVGSGHNQADYELAQKYDVLLKATPSHSKVSVAEHALRLLFASTAPTLQEKGEELSNKKATIIGFGNVGKELAKFLKGLNCDVRVYESERADEAFRKTAKEIGVSLKGNSSAATWKEKLEPAVSDADYVFFCNMFTPENKTMINESVLDVLKEGVRLINISRMGIFDEKALAAKLESGKVASFATDTSTYLTRNILKAKNVIHTPHIAYFTKESLNNANKTVLDNVSSYLGIDVSQLKTLPAGFPAHKKAEQVSINKVFLSGLVTDKKVPDSHKEHAQKGINELLKENFKEQQQSISIQDLDSAVNKELLRYNSQNKAV